MSRAPVALALLSLACAPRDFDDVDAVDLGVPAAAVFGYSDIGEAMFVFSDVSYLCELLHTPGPPEFSDWWVVSTWTRSSVRLGEDLPAEGYMALSVLDEVEEHRMVDSWLRLKVMDPDYARGVLYAELDTGDRIKARFEAEPCDADLFIGL